MANKASKATKKTAAPAAALTLSGHEQTTLRILLQAREQANASLAAASGFVRNYLIQLLQERGLDPNKWGISPDMKGFTEIKPPEAAPAQPAQPGQPAPFVQPTAPAAAAKS